MDIQLASIGTGLLVCGSVAMAFGKLFTKNIINLIDAVKVAVETLRERIDERIDLVETRIRAACEKDSAKLKEELRAEFEKKINNQCDKH